MGHNLYKYFIYTCNYTVYIIKYWDTYEDIRKDTFLVNFPNRSKIN